MYELIIENNGNLYSPLIEGDIIWTTERLGSPGKLEFNVLKDEIINFQEGNSVRFRVNDKNVFFGYVWDKARNKDQIIKVTAYDQLRYLKYKDSYLYENKKASDVLKIIASQQNLKIGDVEDTGYVIVERARHNETLLDIIYDAIKLTFDNTKKLYVLYDDFGRLTLKNMESMRINLKVDDNTAEDFDYKTSLDNVYNHIKLSFKDKDNVGGEIPPAEDKNSIKNWGKLQYFEEIDEKTNVQAKANALLELYNRKNKILSIKNAIGDIRARAGTNLEINLPNIGDISIQNHMLIEGATHRFSNNEHFMDLKLEGRL
ncbi:hydrolase [Alkaliphilus sp. MSJ-5]|uniref:Hydrolase n=1 Tax=Alkaliphilus flagellatus TaxID=2841507 RepID=A0ABS6G2Q5_9FIRM|nr:hydrolase [Alkaliphilus flagellatus]MBU5676752.1 hydrolase [Alkaliphilus flagellatus]